jgi:hypothetical protein
MQKRQVVTEKHHLTEDSHGLAVTDTFQPTDSFIFQPVLSNFYKVVSFCLKKRKTQMEKIGLWVLPSHPKLLF